MKLPPTSAIVLPFSDFRRGAGLTGVTADSLSVMGSTRCDGYRYRALVSNGTTPPLPSSAATLTVRPVELAIKAQPRSVKANDGKTVTFKVKAVGATRYQWYEITPDGREDPVGGAVLTP